MRKALVIGNWKMNGLQARNDELVRSVASGVADEAFAGVDIGLCPPSVYLQTIGLQLAGTSVALGAQNMSQHASGAYTGEVSAEMLADVGCSLVILGHSERRALFNESDEDVAAKVKAALAAQLTPVVCVGETLQQREAGEAVSVVSEQVLQALSDLDVAMLEQVVVAYEPVWAIGTGLTASPEQAQEIHAALRKVLSGLSTDAADKVRILYGGSVNAANADALFAKPDIDGGLIGGASLKAEDFIAICRAAAVAG
ncbi:triose-phosphate isomerase [Marinobacterium sediminicola]|uniref:Triosephosphate isomerase n=1 Tax=Marinobacterium sediminicola TaxID=518898 RepID=A0ABY1S492_9GAMM|nr:triose-phosphate isomerase [Marinobacterium sediminicola]ULG68915.1 triose-phosphate isomerase [Marinobacterium sediminicola]SMR77883.1 triosephosphate isomerase [Marinobacterium sediminicola]